MTMLAALNGQVAVVTGCTRGFGRVLISDMARAGAHVVVSSPFDDENQQLAQELRDGGFSAVAAIGDVTSRDQMSDLAATAVKEFGRLDIWVNNAAFESPGMARSLDFGEDGFDAVTAVNVSGTYNATMAALRVMLDQGSGTIVNVSGRGDDLRTAAFTNPYGASKAWNRSFTKSLRAEYSGRGVSIVSFNPGVMNTDRIGEASGDDIAHLDPKLQKIYPIVMRVLGDPPEVASARLIEFLASGRAVKQGELRLITPVKVAKGVGAEAARWGKQKVAARNR